jgi:hypothetical protein
MNAHWQKLGTKLIDIDKIKSVDRIIAPTKTRIESMARSLSGPLGQLEPIMVTKYLNSPWKIVAGATRHAAAVQLGWKQIEATIIGADNDFEYQLIEITENLHRHDLSDTDRAKLKAKEDSIVKARLAFFDELLNRPIAGTEAQATLPPRPPAPHRATGKPAGRPKGGVSDAARKAGVPRTTAHDRVKKSKGGISSGSGKAGRNPPAPPPGKSTNRTPDGSESSGTAERAGLLRCSFCRKSQHDAIVLVAGTGVYICDECIELCVDIFRRQKEKISSNPDGPDDDTAKVFATRSLINLASEVCTLAKGSLDGTQFDKKTFAAVHDATEAWGDLVKRLLAAKELAEKTLAPAPSTPEDDSEIDETIEDDDDDDSTFIADEEEGDEDVTDIIGEV